MSRLSSILEISGGLLTKIGVGRPLSVGSTIRRVCYVNGQFRVDFVVLICFRKGVKTALTSYVTTLAFWHEHLGQSGYLYIAFGVSACGYWFGSGCLHNSTSKKTLVFTIRMINLMLFVEIISVRITQNP
jgi:hypothetical protein